jgi:Nucleotide modification associated domain 2
MDHDFGFAPNPFHGVCTLACCKPGIRKHAKEGDLIMGTGSAPHGIAGHLCYWMRVEKILTFDQYWMSSSFVRKRPDLRGSLMWRYGDNIYHRDSSTGAWLQADSFHSLLGGVSKLANVRRDTFQTDHVLIGQDFCYWGGDKPPRIPDHLRRFVHTTQGHRNRFSETEKAALMDWLATIPQRGWVGDPADWPSA